MDKAHIYNYKSLVLIGSGGIWIDLVKQIDKASATVEAERIRW